MKNNLRQELRDEVAATSKGTQAIGEEMYKISETGTIDDDYTQTPMQQNLPDPDSIITTFKNPEAEQNSFFTCYLYELKKSLEDANTQYSSILTHSNQSLSSPSISSSIPLFTRHLFTHPLYLHFGTFSLKVDHRKSVLVPGIASSLSKENTKMAGLQLTPAEQLCYDCIASCTNSLTLALPFLQRNKLQYTRVDPASPECIVQEIETFLNAARRTPTSWSAIKSKEFPTKYQRYLIRTANSTRDIPGEGHHENEKIVHHVVNRLLSTPIINILYKSDGIYDNSTEVLVSSLRSIDMNAMDTLASYLHGYLTASILLDYFKTDEAIYQPLFRILSSPSSSLTDECAEVIESFLCRSILKDAQYDHLVFFALVRSFGVHILGASSPLFI